MTESKVISWHDFCHQLDQEAKQSQFLIASEIPFYLRRAQDIRLFSAKPNQMCYPRIRVQVDEVVEKSGFMQVVDVSLMCPGLDSDHDLEHVMPMLQLAQEALTFAQHLEKLFASVQITVSN